MSGRSGQKGAAKRAIKVALVVCALVSAIYYLITLLPKSSPTDQDITILLVENEFSTTVRKQIHDAYRSVLEEEGVPFRVTRPDELLSLPARQVAESCPAIVFPDTLAQILPRDITFWVTEYLRCGGNVAIVFDAGTRHFKNRFLKKTVFADLLGFNYLLYSTLEKPGEAYMNSYVRFRGTEASSLFQFPPGKTDADHFLCGYGYGKLIYPVSRVEFETGFSAADVQAEAVTEAGETFPVLVHKKVFGSSLLYVNLPLGHLKAMTDDLPMRAIMRTFLFDLVRIPHLVNTPDGIGGLVFNWHIDWSEDWRALRFLIDRGFFPPELRFSLHNTAGPFTNKPGDGLGFDACGRGRPLLEAILPHGTLGSHGGWGHNWFASRIADGTFGEAEIETYIRKNNNCLQGISGYPVSEYSAPNGLHPQPVVTRILERNGVEAYYYTGDSGSAPNRTFHQGEMVSERVIAFPVLPFGKNASFYEIDKAGIPAASLREWFSSIIRYLIETRSIRMIYSHPYDVEPYYPQEVKAFFTELAGVIREKKLSMKPMTDYARFLRRFLQTDTRFRLRPGGLDVEVENPLGLQGITIAVPGGGKLDSPARGVSLSRDDHYLYIHIEDHANRKVIPLSRSDR